MIHTKVYCVAKRISNEYSKRRKNYQTHYSKTKGKQWLKKGKRKWKSKHQKTELTDLKVNIHKIHFRIQREGKKKQGKLDWAQIFSSNNEKKEPTPTNPRSLGGFNRYISQKIESGIDPWRNPLLLLLQRKPKKEMEMFETRSWQFRLSKDAGV